MVTELKNFSVGLTLLMEFSYTSVKHQTGVKEQVIKLGLGRGNNGSFGAQVTHPATVQTIEKRQKHSLTDKV